MALRIMSILLNIVAIAIKYANLNIVAIAINVNVTMFKYYQYQTCWVIKTKIAETLTETSLQGF